MVWVVFAVVVRFLVVGFGLLMIFWWALMWLVCFGFVLVLEFFFFLWVLWPAVVFSGGGGFRYGVDLQWRMLWFFGFAVEDAIGFLDLGLDAWFGWVFMAGGGNSRSEVREGEWGFGCENQRNHQEGEWESRFVRKKDKKRKV